LGKLVATFADGLREKVSIRATLLKILAEVSEMRHSLKVSHRYALSCTSATFRCGQRQLQSASAGYKLSPRFELTAKLIFDFFLSRPLFLCFAFFDE
jgi:hypothetical protein